MQNNRLNVVGVLLFFIAAIACKQRSVTQTVELISYKSTSIGESAYSPFRLNLNMTEGSSFDTLLLPIQEHDGLAVFQGDIIIGDTTGVLISPFGFDFQLLAPELLVNTQGKWTNNTLIYSYHGSIDTKDQAVIESALNEWSSKTEGVVKFKLRKGEKDFVEFIGKSGYASSVGMIGGKQQLYIYRDRASKGNVMHEIGHALGLWHEHSRPDRDEHITILKDNIVPEYACQFVQLITNVTTLGTSYDFNSIMHYPLDAFHIPGARETIKVNKPNNYHIGNRDSLSQGDIRGVKMLYSTEGGYTPIKRQGNLHLNEICTN